MTHVARRRQNAPLPPYAVRLRELVPEGDVSAVARAIGAERSLVQKWRRGEHTPTKPYREKLAAYFRVAETEFAPADPLSDVTPLLERVEEIRRSRGLRVGTIVGVVRRLAEPQR